MGERTERTTPTAIAEKKKVMIDRRKALLSVSPRPCQSTRRTIRAMISAAARVIRVMRTAAEGAVCVSMPATILHLS
jgi:hypothetical protein